MVPPSLALILVAAVFLLTHLGLERLRSRRVFGRSPEFLLLGLLLGPALANGEPGWPALLDQDILLLLTPLASLAIGWVGLLYGLRLDIRRLLADPGSGPALAATQALATFACIFLLARWVLGATPLLDLGPGEATRGAFFLGATAAISGPAALAVSRGNNMGTGPLSSLLQRARHLDEVLVVFVFGLLFAFQQGRAGPAGALTPTEWYALTLGVGVAVGLLSRQLLRPGTEAPRRLLVLGGVALFSAGLALYLAISPLLVSLVAGVILGNTETAPGTLGEPERLLQPVILLLLVFAGAAWTPVPLAALGLTVLYVSARALAKMGGGLLAGLAMSSGSRRDLGRGLMGHGEMALAMAVSFKLACSGPLTDWAFTAVLASVVLNDLWSAGLLRGLLRSAGELDGPTEPVEEMA